MAIYHFVTQFEVRAPIQDVYGLIVEPEPWLHHWHDLVQMRRVREAGPDGLGGCLAGSVRAPFGYRITGRVETVDVVAPHWIRMELGGALEGAGTWQLRDRAGVTTTTFTMSAMPAARWLRALTPVARPLFEAGHHRVVRDAVDAAAAVLDAEVVAFRSDSEPDAESA